MAAAGKAAVSGRKPVPGTAKCTLAFELPNSNSSPFPVWNRGTWRRASQKARRRARRPNLLTMEQQHVHTAFKGPFPFFAVRTALWRPVMAPTGECARPARAALLRRFAALGTAQAGGRPLHGRAASWDGPRRADRVKPCVGAARLRPSLREPLCRIRRARGGICLIWSRQAPGAWTVGGESGLHSGRGRHHVRGDLLLRREMQAEVQASAGLFALPVLRSTLGST